MHVCGFNPGNTSLFHIDEREEDAEIFGFKRLEYLLKIKHFFLNSLRCSDL